MLICDREFALRGIYFQEVLIVERIILQIIFKITKQDSNCFVMLNDNTNSKIERNMISRKVWITKRNINIWKQLVTNNVKFQSSVV